VCQLAASPHPERPNASATAALTHCDKLTLLNGWRRCRA
jgi:hypothetical protein